MRTKAFEYIHDVHQGKTCPLNKCNRDFTCPDVKCICLNKSRVKSCIYTYVLNITLQWIFFLSMEFLFVPLWSFISQRKRKLILSVYCWNFLFSDFCKRVTWRCARHDIIVFAMQVRLNTTYNVNSVSNFGISGGGSLAYFEAGYGDSNDEFKLALMMLRM